MQGKVQQLAMQAWEATKGVALKLVVQARELAERIVEAAKPERLAAWTRDHLQPGQLGRIASDRALAAPAGQKPSELSRGSSTLQFLRLATPGEFSRYSMEDQYRIYSRLMDQLQVIGKVKVDRVAAKGAKRLERREAQATGSEADRPQKPQGLLAAFKKREYDQAVKAYWQRQRRDRSLADEAAKLQTKVLEATHHSENWAVRKLGSLQPEFMEKVKRDINHSNWQVQMTELEAKRKLQQERGVEGPEMKR